MISARDILPALFAFCTGLIEIRALPSGPRCFTLPQDNPTRAAFVKKNAHYNLYWGVATRRSDDNGTEANCLHLGALFVDLDFKDTPEADARARLATLPLAPSLVINSGGGLHCYWFLREPLDVQQDNPRLWLQRLATYLHADPSCAEPARILRIPNTVNHKYESARRVTIESFDPEARYNLTEFDEWLPTIAIATTVAPIGVSGPILEGSRNSSLYKLARSLRAKGIEAPAIALAIQSVNQAQCHPPLPESEITSIVKQATTQGNRNDFTGSAGHAPDISTPVLIRLSDVQSETIDWIWPGRYARGKKTLIAGDPGLGKSSFLFDSAARITAGAAWPDGGYAPTGNVLFLLAEDGIADTVRPKIDGLGGDCNRVFILDAVRDSNGASRPVNLARDLAALEAAITEVQPVLVVVDPITAFLGKTDSYKDAEVRGLLAPLLATISRQRCALVTVAHLAKDQTRAALHRPGGSIAFVAAARLAFVLAADPQDENRRVLAAIKSNICQKAPSLSFRFPDGILAWDSTPANDLDAEALLRPAPSDDREARSDAETILRELLDDHSLWPLDAKRAAAEGAAHNISQRTLQRTAAKLGIRISRVGFGDKGRWVWHRPIGDIPDRTLPASVRVSSMASMANPSSIDANNNIDDKLTCTGTEDDPNALNRF